MNRRHFATLALALSLTALPTLAKDKEPAVAPKPYVSAVVDPDPTHNPQDVLFLDLSNGGRVTIRLMPTWAPNHVERVKELTRQGFYNGVIFHRVIDGFMAQTGDPTGTGTGGSKLPDVKAEFNSIPHVRGSVSMARADNVDSANSQFFIAFYPRFALDRKYTNFGRVIGGMDVVDRIEKGEPPANPTKIVRASMAAESAPAAPATTEAPAAPVAEAPAAPAPELPAAPAQ
jgi:cyclophilin family peptidyl-prolyl cis-trans isomerase